MWTHFYVAYSPMNQYPNILVVFVRLSNKWELKLAIQPGLIQPFLQKEMPIRSLS